MAAHATSSSPPSRRGRGAALLLLAPGALGGGCATVNPTLTPARVLAPGRFAVETGGAYAAPAAESVLTEARAAAASLEAGAGGDAERASLVRGAAAFGPSPPGVAGYVSARVGLPAETEAHLALAGRAVRAGARHVFWSSDPWALSLGAQLRVAPLGVLLDGSVPGLSVRESRLYGGDVSMLVGRTNNDLYDVWLGVRAGYTYGDSVLALGAVNAGNPFGATLHRLDIAATLGIRVGFGRLSVLAELEAAFGYFWAGSALGVDGSGAVFSLVPAGALSWAF